MSDMGAIDPLRWQSWHFSWKIGVMSLAKVGVFAAGSAAVDNPETARQTESAKALLPKVRAIPMPIVVVSLLQIAKAADGRDRQRHGTCRTVGSLSRFGTRCQTPRAFGFAILFRWCRFAWRSSAITTNR